MELEVVPLSFALGPCLRQGLPRPVVGYSLLSRTVHARVREHTQAVIRSLTYRGT